MNVRLKTAPRGKEPPRFLTVILLTLLAVTIITVPGQAQSVNKSDATGKIVIADGSSINSAPLYVALQNGYFRQEGLKVVCRLFPSGKAALDAVRRGEGDLATVADIPLMHAVLEGAPLKIVAVISEAFRENALVARRDRGILTEKDLAGKKIGVTPGTVSEFFLDEFLFFNRTPRKRVRMIYLSPDRIPEALEKGEIDAAVTWNPLLSKMQERWGANLNVFYGKGRYRMLWNIAGLKNRLAGDPAAVQKILRALIRGVAFIREKPGEARKITSGYLGLQEAQIGAVWGDRQFQVSLPSLLLMNLENQTRWAMRNKSTPKTGVPNILPNFYFEGLTAVDPEAVTIIH
ncbi:MAG: ABC transporter substrate-binding protein [Deltaproteobacteria bacterium]|nr:ABC transporter substrate-binding protein [Deltaproteobacteria bacterium]